MIQLLYILFCILFANLNAYLIEKKNLRVYHGLNGLLHLAIQISCGYFFGWLYLPVLMLEARVSFDWMLNIFRGKSLDYVPKKPKAISDKVEKWIFGEDGAAPKIIYIVICLIINLLVGFKIINW